MKRFTIAGALLLALAAGMPTTGGLSAQQQRGRKETLTRDQQQRLGQNLERAVQERQTAEKQALAKLDATRQQFLSSKRQKVEAMNASIRATIAGYRVAPADARFDAIEREARDLSRRAATATPAERAAIDRRAAELLRQLTERR